MKRLKVNLFVGMVTAALFALLLAPKVTQAQGTWTAVPSPSSNELHAVASVSANDVWAVGVGPITEHWNGSVWSIVSSPNVANGKLLGVAAVSTSDVWAVGFTVIGSPPLIEHWNGTSWRTVKAPRQAGVLNGVTAVSSSDVWAVGDFNNASRALERQQLECRRQSESQHYNQRLQWSRHCLRHRDLGRGGLHR